MNGPLFIAEVKTQSPFGFQSSHSVHALLDMALEHGDMVAAHTGEQFGGSYEHLELVAREAHACGKLVLAKGYHHDDAEVLTALDAGADLVLVVDRQPSRELESICIAEPLRLHSLAHPRRHRIMWNERDLSTGVNKTDGSIKDARRMFRGWLCQASFIRSPADVFPGVDAFIVGEHLPQFVEELCR